VNGIASKPGHWPEYLIEAAGLALFMISASAFATLLEHPTSPARQAVADPLARRALMGIAMAGTAMALTYSPWGRRSGAHFNPALTLTFFRLGKVAPRDLVGYVIAQFVGGTLGIAAASLAIGASLAHPSVNYVATQPGAGGVVGAFVAEVAITGILMLVVLFVSNTPRLAPYTGLCAGICVALFITFEAPFSGMSLNPARSLASALATRDISALWVYFAAPPIGMLAAATLYRRWRGRQRISCAKLMHMDHQRCIFCEYHRS
jgi:aquaporin Z